ncbi:MAG: glycosyl transferase GT4 family protein [Nitrospirae bacterium]|nr:glycosyl transferase GT4 family protein [Nitrospirota bacterium]
MKSKFGFNSHKGLHEQLKIQESKNFDYSTWKSKMIKFVREVIAFPDNFIGWYNYAIDSASDLLVREKVDAMISTSYPVTAHLIASKLKKKYRIPWIADFRDLWTQNHYVNKYKLIKYIERRLELKTLSDADVLVTAHPLVNVLQRLHKSKKILCITNGYDVDDFPEIQVKLTDKFTITYTGKLYNGKRDPSMLFKAVEELINEKKIKKELTEIRFFGCNEKWLIDEIKKYNLEGVVTVNGIIPREEALKKQRESQILLILRWDNKNEEGIFPGKVFEYFGAKRPIIAVGSGGVIKDILEKTNAGKFAENEFALKNILFEYYREFIETGKVKYRGNINTEKYKYDSITRKYSEVLNELV